MALFYAALFVVFGVHMPFFPVWLEAQGLDARAIGFVLAVPMVVRVSTVALLAREADRRNALHLAIVLASMASVAGYVLLAFTHDWVTILAVFTLASLAFTPMVPLIDAYAIEGLRARKRAYGPVRLWGSVAFIAATMGGGVIADLIAPQNLIWLIVAPMAVTAAASFMLVPLARDPHPAGTPLRAAALMRDPAFLAVVAAASFIQVSHAVYYGFSTIDWKGTGLDGSVIGALWAVGVIAEIALFALSGRLPPAIGPRALLLIGAGGAIVRWTVMAADPPLWALPPLQCLHALSYGATHLGTLGLISRVAPNRLAATAQGYLSMALGLLNAAATSLAGILYAAYGDRAYAAMALVALAGGVIAMASRGLWNAAAQRSAA